MNEALSVFANAHQAGITFQIEGDDLIVEGPFTDEMLTAFRTNKAELLKLIATANRLLQIAKDERIGPALVEQLGDNDLADCAKEPDEVLKSFLPALADGAIRRAGQVPKGYICQACPLPPLWANMALYRGHLRRLPLVLESD